MDNVQVIGNEGVFFRQAMCTVVIENHGLAEYGWNRQWKWKSTLF